jgi:hypothetical protein
MLWLSGIRHGRQTAYLIEYSDGWKTTVIFDYRAFPCKVDPWGETPKGQFYEIFG